MRAAAAAQLHELTAYHALQRLHDLRQQAQGLLPAPTSALAAGSGAVTTTASSPAAAAAREASSPSDAGMSPSGALAAPGQSLLTERRASGIAAAVEATAGAANPAAALLAATRGSPDLALLGPQSREPASPAAAAQRSRLARQRAQQLAAKVAEAAAAAAGTLCALGDADGIAGLQAFCRRSFQPLLQLLYARQAVGAADSMPATESLLPAAADDATAAAAAASAWDWLSAAGHQAAGQYEAAIRQYSELCSSTGSAGQQCVPGSTLGLLAAQAYAAVGDAEGLAAWLHVSHADLAAHIFCVCLQRLGGCHLLITAKPGPATVPARALLLPPGGAWPDLPPTPAPCPTPDQARQQAAAGSSPACPAPSQLGRGRPKAGAAN